ncbi:lytic transglycosylase domain-containing protein [soil metagenome]
MKQPISIALVVMNIVLLGFIFASNITSNQATAGNTLDDVKPGPVTIKILPVKLPKYVDFAGEVVPLDIFDVRERLDREMTVNAYWHSNSLSMFKLKNRMFPVIEKVLKEEGVPDDFKYLALAESGLRNVISPSKATGIWQFMEPTAKNFGLEVNEEIDERYHLEKSTRAACKYLKQTKAEFGSWALAAAAYNMGNNGLRKMVDSQKMGSYYDLYLNEETSRYVFRIIALKEIFNSPQHYGFYLEKEDLYDEIPTRKIAVDTTVNDLAAFAIEQGSNYKMLKLLNPWMRSGKLTNTTGKKYKIELPK